MPNQSDQPDRYRWENGKLFEYDSDQNAYIFVAAGNGRSKEETIRDYEDQRIPMSEIEEFELES